MIRVIVAAHDEQLYEARLIEGVWVCGRCKRGTLEPVMGAHCSECPAHVSLVVNGEGRET